MTSVRVRDGIQNRYGFTLPDADRVTGLMSLKVGGPTGDLQVPAAFSALGNLYIESPAGSGHVTQISGPLVPLPANASMQGAAAFKNGYLAFTNLKNSLGLPAVYNPILNKLDPLSMKQVGQLWTAATQYYVGEVVCPASPVGGNGHSYRCTVAGVSGNAQPAFPTAESATVADGGVTWQETTPVMAQAIAAPSTPPNPADNPGAGAFAAGRDVYLVFTLVNGVGETTTSTPVVFVNTALNDQILVNTSNIWPQFLWESALPAPFKPTGYNLYEADVATAGAAPALSTYKKVAGGPFALNTSVVLNAAGAGAAPPTTNSATIVPAGNICAGLRYMVVLFVNRNGYISGMTAASVISYNGSTNGFKLYVAHIPTGPSNTIARICAFTPAGQLNQLAGTGISNAGPYFWINVASQYLTSSFSLSGAPVGVSISDVVNGVQMTATLINDNTSTTATFNFTDDYLKSTTNDVSAFFRKIQVPPCSDVWYSKTLQRMFYANDDIQSGWRVSLLADPESVYGDTSAIVQVAENDGKNRTAIREYGGIIYPMKENSGHVLTPSTDDPSKWNVVQQWEGSGPCGPRAVDVCSSFMCYVHRSGVWIFKSGQPFLISKEIPAHTGVTWKNINWFYQQTIWVMVDDETKEIRIGVPYGQSTVPSIVLKCNYEESPDFNPPIHFSPYIGKEIASGTCYKWSIDDISANLAIRAERTIQNPPPKLDPATIQSQILFASSNPDGHVDPIIPYCFDDNGVGIDSVYETSAPQELMRPSQLRGVQANIDGYGQGSMEVLALRAVHGGPAPPGGQPAANAGFVRKLKKPWIAGVPYSCGASGQNERFRLRISNNKQPGVWYDLKWAAIYSTPVSSARPG